MTYPRNFQRITLLATCLVLIQHATLFAQNVDPSFKPVIKGIPYISAIHTLTDGKIIIGGEVSSVGLTPTRAVLKLNADGTMDQTFQSSIFLVNPGRISTIEVDQDGKVLVGAIQQKLDGSDYLIRLNPDGSFDGSFSNGNKLQHINRIKALPDGKYLVTSSYTYQLPACFYRINNDGSIDETFNAYQEPGGSYTGALEVQEDGKILCAINYPSTTPNIFLSKLVRLNPNGSLDETFETGICEYSEINPFINDIKLQSDGKIVIAGIFKTFKNQAVSSIVRLNSDGTNDPSFNNPGFLDTLISYGTITSIDISTKNRIAVTGTYFFNANFYETVVSINNDGSINGSFTPSRFLLPMRSWANPTVRYDDDRLYILGDHLSVNSTMCMGIAAIDSTGTLIKEFSPLIGGNPIVSAVLQQKNGKIIIGGVFSQVDSLYTNNIVRFNKNGTVDTTFLRNIGTGLDLQLRSIACQSDSSIIIGGDFTSVNGNQTGLLARLKPDGSLDEDFKAYVTPVYSGGGINKVIVDSTDQLIIGGAIEYVNNEPRKGFAVLNPDGSLNSSFAAEPIIPNNTFTLNDMAYQSDKRLVIIGNFNNSEEKGFIVRLDQNGVVEPDFPNNLSNYYVFSLDILKDNSIAVGNIGWNDDSRIILLDADGELVDNTSIAFKQKDEGDPVILSIQHTGNDQLIAGGRFSSVNGVEKPALIKVSLKGDVDEYFKYEVDGRILRFLQEDSTHLFVAGNFNRIGNDNDLFCIARIDINFPDEPTDLSGENSSPKGSKSSGITLNWKDHSTNESGFSIEKSTDNETFVKIATVGDNTFSYNDQAVEVDEKYYYRVKAYNTSGGSSYSNVAEIVNTTTGITPIDNINEVLITPNPGDGDLNILFNGFGNLNHTIEIYNITGRCVYRSDLKIDSKSYQFPVDITKEPAGIYFIKVTSDRITKPVKYIKR